MTRRKVVKAICVPLGVALGSTLAAETADNPHVESRQHEEEPRMTYESAYTTTSMVVVNFPVLDSSLEAIPVLRHLQK